MIERQSPNASDDLRELWRRIAFSILIRNTDDHLRNHGFLRTNTAGWSLAPAFDLNPNPRPGAAYLSTRIDYDTTEASVDVLMGVAEFFRLTDDDARSILRDVTHATSRWRHAAKQAGLDRDAVDKMAAAFEHDQTATARQLTGAPV